MADKFQKEFPQLKPGHSYLDSAAMSLKPECVIGKVDDYYCRLSVNVHRGLYPESIEASALYEEARAKIARFLNASKDEIVYTRGTTNSLNMVTRFLTGSLKEGDEIITSELEHHSSFLPWQALAKSKGLILKFVPLDQDGRITVDNFKKVLSAKTKIVALTYVSNVMGYITPIEEIIGLAHEKGALVIVDAAQAVPHFKVDVKAIDADFLAFSGHKMLGPTGIGILYGKKALLDKLEPVEYGGDMIDDVGKEVSSWKKPPYRFEAGTMPIAEAIGLGEAVTCLNRYGFDNISKKEKLIHETALRELAKIDGVKIYNPGADTAIIAFNLENIPSHDAVSFYAEKGVSVRAGQHCAELLADWLGIASSLRASFYLYNDVEDALRLAEVTKQAIAYFRNLGF